jgi:hypothetical protein
MDKHGTRRLVLELDRYFDQNWICSVREKQIGQIVEKVVSSNEIYVDKL